LSAVFRDPRATADDGVGGGSVEDSTSAFSRHFRLSLARPLDNAAAAAAARMMEPRHHQPVIPHLPAQ